ncbi:MAG: glycosyltransferase [Chloroflexota bacterium]|nr:glycosyltransferase [Chloroflexota bacterium]
MNVYVRELGCQLGQLGLPVDIFTRRTNSETPERLALCPNVNVIAIAAGPPQPLAKNDLFPYLPEFAAEMALYSLREGIRYDVMHAHYWLSGWAAHLARRYWDAPFVQMFHTTAHMKNAVAAVADRESMLRGQIERRLLDLADSVIAANPDERADLVWRQGTANAKVCTIPPGVDLDLFRPRDRDDARKQLDLPPDQPILLFVGRIDPIKGIDTLLAASERLRDHPALTSPPLILFVGGDLDAAGEPEGPLAAVVAEADARGVADRFRFVGSQPQDQLPLFYSAADLVVVPSRYESFGLVAIEAMACGTPVVASRVGGLTFTIDEGGSGLLVPPNDPEALAEAVALLLLDSGCRRALASGALTTAERFAWPSVAASIMHVYQRLADGHRANLCCEEDLYA